MSQRTIKSFDEFALQLKADAELQQEFKNDPAQAIDRISMQNPLDYDKFIYRVSVLALGFTIVSVTTGLLVVLGREQVEVNQQVATILTAIGSGSVGALAGLIAPTTRTTS